MRLSAIASLALSGVLLATVPEGGDAQGAAAECIQEPNGEYSRQRQCWDGGKRQGRWVVRLPGGEVREGSYVAGKKQGHWVIRLADGGVQEGSYVAGEKQGRWVLRFADGTVEEGPYVAGLREGGWVAHRPDGSRRTFVMDGGTLVAGSVRVVAQAQGREERHRVQSAPKASEAAPPTAAQQAQQNDSPPLWRIELRPHGDRAAQQNPPLWSLFGITYQPSNAARIMEALRKGADPNARDGNGNTSVHYAAAYHVGILRAVIAHGGRCTTRNSFGTTPLHVAAAQGGLGAGPEAVRILLDCGASLGERDDRGNTPLHALYEGAQEGGLSHIPHVSSLYGGSREDVLKALLEGGADPNIKNNAKDTPMMVLLKGGGGVVFTRQSHLRLFLKHDANPDTVDGEGVTALIRTILVHDGVDEDVGDDLAGMLLKAEADPDKTDRRGDTPLIHVLKLEENDRPNLVAALLKAEAKPNKRDRRGDTPLIHVAKSEYDIPEILDALLEAGADPCLTDRNGKLPSDHATNEYTRIVLINAGGFLVPDLEGGEEQCRRDMLAGAGEEKALALGRDERRRIQSCLKAQGHDPGPADGVFGSRTRAAVRGWQAAKGGGAPATGYLTRAHADTLLSACQVAEAAEPDAAASGAGAASVSSASASGTMVETAAPAQQIEGFRCKNAEAKAEQYVEDFSVLIEDPNIDDATYRCTSFMLVRVLLWTYHTCSQDVELSVTDRDGYLELFSGLKRSIDESVGGRRDRDPSCDTSAIAWTGM